MEDNIYQPPQANLEPQLKTEGLSKIYSPNQVALGALGGPVGLVYFLWANFKALDQFDKARTTLIIGTISIALIVAILPFLPEDVPSSMFSITYIIIGRLIAEKMQMTKNGIFYSEAHDFQSSWRVFGIALLSLIVSSVVFMIPLFLMAFFGIWNPA